MISFPQFGVEYHIRQESSSRYLDAWFGQYDDSAVTRESQAGSDQEDTQVWTFELKGQVYTYQQASNDQYLDAWTVNQNTEGNIVNHQVVTRPSQDNATQEWYQLSSETVAKDGPVVGGPPAILHRLRQLKTKRYLDAYETSSKDHAAVTRKTQADSDEEDTQLWELVAIGNTGDNTYTIRQRSSGRFLDAYPNFPYNAVTRESQLTEPSQTLTQRWIRTHVGGLFTIRRKANGVVLDAYTSGSRNAVVRADKGDDTQIWLVRDAGDGRVTIQQLNTLYYLDAYETGANDHSVVTRDSQADTGGADTQRWRITEV